MFSSKKRSAALAAQAQARQEAALAGAGLGISSHQRNASSSTTASIPKPMVSPLQMTFDFELPPSPALSTTNTGEYFRRSRDSDNRERFVPSRDSETPGPSGLSGLSGLGGLSNAGQQRSSSANLAPPPTLPPIARIASLKDDSEREDKDVRGMEASEARKADERTREQGATQKVITPIPAILPTGEDGDDISTAGKRSNVKPIFGFDLPPNDFRSFSRPTSSAGSLKVATLTPPLLQEPPPTTSSAGSTPIMESSLFPAKDGSSISKIDTTPAMTRAFIDSRDKPYGAPAPGKRPQQPLQSTLSSPDLLASSRTTTITAGGRTVSSNYNDFSALSGPSTSASHPNLRPAPQSAHTSPNLLKHPPTSYSGSTQWSSVSSNSTAAASQQSRDVPMLTIGTPYQETASSFPLPQHVATRPRTAGAPVATIGGVSVPTHHTSGYLRPDQHTSAKSEKVEKGERRKTRLLNPMALLARRRSGHDDVSLNNEKAVQAAQAAALQRQKNVAAVGVSKMPEDFDPRIRGKVVHDFSAPRQPRSTPMGRVMAYHHANGQQTQPDLVRGSSVPLIPTVQAEGSTTKQQSRHTSDGTPSGGARRSVHGGMFREHLGEDTDQTRRGNNIQAERLENKDFLHRASYLSHQSTVSQESAVLPPFARRSQALDPAQAALFNDESSSDQGKGTSGYERDSAISSLEGISPVTARSSAIQQLRSEDARAMRESMSPVSPDSPDKRVSVIGSGSESGSASASRNESRSTSAVPVTAISPPESTVVVVVLDCFVFI